MRTLDRKYLIALSAMTLASFIRGQGLAGEPVEVVTSTADLGAIVRAVGGDKVSVTTIAQGYQDPHYVQAKPSYMLKVRRARLLFYMGLQLETGWLPLLVEGARNPTLVSVPVTQGITVLEVPAGEVTRAQGDIHPEGNPHYWLDPRNGATVARTVAQALARAQPSEAAGFEERGRAFTQALEARIGRWQQSMAPYRGKPVVAYHKQWEYLASWLGLEIVGYIEDKPGVPPSPAHLAALIHRMRAQGVSCVIAATFVDPKIPALVADKGGVPLVVLPASVAAVAQAGDYFQLFDTITERLAQAFAGKGGS